MEELVSCLKTKRNATEIQSSVAESVLDAATFFELLQNGARLGEYCVLRKRHFLKDLLIHLKSLDSTASFDHLSLIQELPWVQHIFGAFLVLFCWDDVTAGPTKSVLPVLSNLLSLTNTASTSVLDIIGDAVHVLRSQFNVVQALLVTGVVDQEDYSDIEFNELFDKAFPDLKETSVLPAVLNFSKLDRVTVEFIQNLPIIRNSIDPDFCSKKVRFEDDDEDSVLILPADRAKDITVFRGYSILLDVMVGIYQDAASRKMTTSSKRSSRLSLYRESSATDSETTSSDFVSTEKNLEELVPLNYRLEVMENIFSLLFLRSNDLEESYLPEEKIVAEESDMESLKSWSSVGKSIREGFSCCSDVLVRAILTVLREVAIFTSSQNKNDVDSSAQVYCSISFDEFPSRLASFQQRVADALWRLDVVTFPKDIPFSLNPAYADDLVRPSFLTRKLDSKKSKRRRQRKRRTSTILKKHVDTSVVEKMLANPGSLLRMCLHRSTFDLADQVIKIFSLDDADWSKELQFGQNYHNYRQHLFRKDKPVRSRKPEISWHFDDIPLSPSPRLTDEHVKVLVSIDTAFLNAVVDFSNCGVSVKAVVDSLSVLPVRFPTTKSMDLPETRPFEDFIKTYLETSVVLSRRLPFLKALPFDPTSFQSFAAFQEEISRCLKRMRQLLLEGAAGGNMGIGILKQLNKIMRSSLSSGGLLMLINGQRIKSQDSRTNYLLSTIMFLKNYAACLKRDPDVDNFDLLYQSPYQHIIRVLKTKPSGVDVDAFIKTMSLDIPRRLLFRGIPANPTFSPVLSTDGPIILNAADLDLSFYGTDSMMRLVTSTLVKILTIFKESEDSIYSPKVVSWSMVAECFSGIFALQRADLSSLQTDEERLVFFINTYNLLFIHAGFHARVHSVHETVARWEQNDVTTRLHFWRYRYQIGSLGAVSLQSLYDGLSPLRSTFAGNRVQPPRRKENGFLLANSDYRLVIRALYPNLLTNQTNLIISEYLNHTASYDARKNLVRLPTWLFQVYPSDQLYNLVREHWKNPNSLVIEPDAVVLEPSRKIIPEVVFRRDTMLADCRELTTPLVSSSAEAEDVGKSGNIYSPTSFRDEAPQIPLEELLPFVASPCSYLFSLLSAGGRDNRLLPANLSPKTLLSLVSGSHNRVLPLDLLCQIFSEAMRHGDDPVSLFKVPVIHYALSGSPAENILRNVLIAMGVEKSLISEPWFSAAGIKDLDLRLRCVQLMWRKWPVNACADLFDLIEVEDSRSVIKGIHVRVKSLQKLIQTLNADAQAWNDLFPHLKFYAVANELPIRDVEKRLENQFTNFIAIMLRLDQIEPLNAWLHQSEMASLAVYEEELQLRGLVHMLDSKPPRILAAYQLILPMLKTCPFSCVEHLLEAISLPEGRLSVIRIALMCGRFDEMDCARLKEKEVENQILMTLPDFFRKTIAHLQGHTLLILEQLIVWHKLDYLSEILKIPSLFEVFSRRLFEGILVDYARKAVEVEVIKSSRSGSIVLDEKRPRRDTTDSDKSARSFIVPPVTPTRNQWTNDSSINNCMVCDDKFGIFNRKHHCRRCGRVVCGSCSSQTIQIDVYGDNPVRACDDCFDHTIALGSSLRSSKSPGITFSAPRMRSPTSLSPLRQADTKLRKHALSVSEGTEQKWLFTTDDTSNGRLRNEFFFANAPDAVLCVGLLKLHSNLTVAGKELLKLGNELSEWIGTHNDCGLENTTVLGTMRTLFFNAKLFLHGDRDTGDWISVCDTYLNQVQLIEMLLDAGATEIPSVQQLAELDTIRRVRDQLVQQERYALAIEISTKAGLDPANVWLSWGRCLLKVGKFVEAEDKLSKCLKPPVDKNQTVPPSGSVLEDIMDIILDARMPRRRGTIGADSIIEVVLHGDILKPETVDPSLIEHENFRKMTECLHYQEAYGTHLSLMKFYMKRGLIQKALEYALRENVNLDTFTDAVVIPCLRAGQLRSLEDELLMSDPTLVKWADYLTGICKQLTKKNMCHVLLSFQLFMKDYLRAATTCVMFFQTGGPANSYQLYFDRLHYLEDAQKHILTYMETNSTDATEKSAKFRLRLQDEEVRKYLKSIQLQVLVTQLLSSKTRIEDRRPSASSSLPTLFGNIQAKTDLIAMVLEHHTSPRFEDYILSIIDLYGLVIEDVFASVAVNAGREGLKGASTILMGMMQQSLLTGQQFDAIVIKMIGQTSQTSLGLAAKQWEALIKQMSSEERKVEAFAKAGKLKSAYLMAVNLKRPDLVEFLASEAGRAGDTSVQNICKRWLEQNKKG